MDSKSELYHVYFEKVISTQYQPNKMQIVKKLNIIVLGAPRKWTFRPWKSRNL